MTRVSRERIHSLAAIVLAVVTGVVQAQEGEEQGPLPLKLQERGAGGEGRAALPAALNPFDAAAVNNEAVTSFENGDYDRALALMERATRLAPHDTAIQQNYRRLRQWLEGGERRLEPPAVVTGRVDDAAAASRRLPGPIPELWR